MKNTPFSINTLRAHRSDEGKKEMAEKAEARDQAAASPEQATREAMRDSRAFGIASAEADATRESIPEILAGENGELFKKYVELHKLDLEKGDLAEISKARVEFLERIEYAEQVRTMVTPELVQQIIQGEFMEGADASSFKLLVDTVKPEVIIDIVRKRMLSLSIETPDRFEALAQRLEFATMHNTSESRIQIEARATEALRKYKIDAKGYEGLRELIDDTSKSDEEKQEELRAQVRRSKWGILGLGQLAADKTEKFLEGELESLRTEEAEQRHEMPVLEEARDKAHAALEALEREWHDSEPEEGEPVPDEVQAAKAAYDRVQKTYAKAVRELNSTVDSINRAERWRSVVDKMTSKKGAEKMHATMQQVIPELEGELAQVNEDMQEIGTVLAATLSDDAHMRAEMGKALLGTREAPEEVAEQGDELVDFAPDEFEFQRNFDQYVIRRRDEGAEDSREDLMKRYRKNEIRRAGTKWETRKKRGFWGFMTRLFGGKRTLRREVRGRKLH